MVASHRYAIDKLPPEVVAYAEEHDAKDVIATSHEPEQLAELHEPVYYKGSWSYRRALMEGLLRFYHTTQEDLHYYKPKLDVKLWRDYHRRVLRLKRIMQTLLPSAHLPNLNLLNQEI